MNSSVRVGELSLSPLARPLRRSEELDVVEMRLRILELSEGRGTGRDDERKVTRMSWVCHGAELTREILWSVKRTVHGRDLLVE